MAMYVWQVRFMPDTQLYPQLEERVIWANRPTSLHTHSILKQVRLEYHRLYYYDIDVIVPDSFELSICEKNGQLKVFTTDFELQQSVDGLDERDRILGLHIQARAMDTGQGEANAAKCAVNCQAPCILWHEELTALLPVISVPVMTNMPFDVRNSQIFDIPADLLIRIGKKTHEGHIEEALKFPGIVFVQLNVSNTRCLIEGYDDDSCRHARASIELFQELYRLPKQYLAKFTDKNYKKINNIRKMSNAIIVEDERNEFYTLFRLIGLSCEVRRALEEFESVVAKLAGPQLLASTTTTNLPSIRGGESASGNGNTAGKKITTGSNAGTNLGPSGLNQVRHGNWAKQNESLEGRLAAGVSRLDMSAGQSGGRGCIVCMDDEAVMALLPCGHKQTCSKCADKLFKGNKKECPSCRTRIKGILRIFAD